MQTQVGKGKPQGFSDNKKKQRTNKKQRNDRTKHIRPFNLATARLTRTTRRQLTTQTNKHQLTKQQPTTCLPHETDHRSRLQRQEDDGL